MRNKGTSAIIPGVILFMLLLGRKWAVSGSLKGNKIGSKEDLVQLLDKTDKNGLLLGTGNIPVTGLRLEIPAGETVKFTQTERVGQGEEILIGSYTETMPRNQPLKIAYVQSKGTHVSVKVLHACVLEMQVGGANHGKEAQVCTFYNFALTAPQAIKWIKE